jgi:hypothetical protein
LLWRGADIDVFNKANKRNWHRRIAKPTLQISFPNKMQQISET